MSEYIKREIGRLKQEKSELLTKLGQSIYYQYRIGQVYSEELRAFSEKITELDQQLHQFYLKIKEGNMQLAHRCPCGNTVDTEDTYCSKCGKEIEATQEEEEKVSCQVCGTGVIMQAKFCHVCGTRQAHKQGVSQ